MTMNPDWLLKHFGQISEAPDAVPRLRRFILDLAVRGKLVEQDQADEPASELLKRIETNRAHGSYEDKRKNQKLHLPIEADEIAPQIPANWVLVRVGELLDIQYGKALPADERRDQGSVPVYGSNGIVGYCETPLAQKPAIIIGRKGSAGALNLCDGPSWTTDVAYFLIPPTFFSIRFLFVALQTLDLENLGKGVKPGLNRSEAYQLPIVVPPLAEQHRIVAKVGELMVLCDELEAGQAKRERRRDRLVAATLHGLNNGDDGSEPGGQPIFEKSARFYFNHLPRLTTRPEHIKELRQTILNLAVRGKLVPQDSGDEPVWTLLSRIRSEKNRLSSAGSRKKQNDANLLDDSSLFFQVPKSWVWTTYRELALEFRYGTSKKCGYETKGHPVLRIPNLSGGKITTEDLKFTKLNEREAEDLSLSVGDILMIRSNGSLNLVGRPALVEGHVKGFCYAGYLVRVRFVPDTVDSRYLIVALNSKLVRDQIEVPIRSAVGLKNVNSTELGNIRIPLPPLAEQHRIVGEVDELMALCDELETRLTNTATTRRQLLEATLHRPGIGVGMQSGHQITTDKSADS